MRAPPPLPGSYLVLELSGTCNLACVHCDRTQVPPIAGEQRARGGPFLDLDLAQALVEDLGSIGARFDTLILFWLGEPLLHPHFASLYPALLRANEHRSVFGKIELHTNAVALDAARARVALNRARSPQVWHLTLDAARAGTYRQVKGRDEHARVEENVERLIALKGELRAPWPRLVLQFIVSDRNQSEIEPFRARWTRCLERAGLRVQTAAGCVPAGGGEDAVIFLRQLDCPTPEEQTRQNAVFRAAATRLGLALPGGGAAPVDALPARNLNPCSGFWKSPVVRWNGDVTVCTRDAGLHMRLGSLRERPFSQLWWSPEARARRERVARGDYGELPLCGDCFIPRSSNYTGISPAEIEAWEAWARTAEAQP